MDTLGETGRVAVCCEGPRVRCSRAPGVAKVRRWLRSRGFSRDVGGAVPLRRQSPQPQEHLFERRAHALDDRPWLSIRRSTGSRCDRMGRQNVHEAAARWREHGGGSVSVTPAPLSCGAARRRVRLPWTFPSAASVPLVGRPGALRALVEDGRAGSDLSLSHLPGGMGRHFRCGGPSRQVRGILVGRTFRSLCPGRHRPRSDVRRLRGPRQRPARFRRRMLRLTSR